MHRLTVAKKIFGANYEVRRPGSEAIVMTIGDRKLRDAKKSEMAAFKPNFWATRTTITDAEGRELAYIAFPFPLFGGKKGCTLHIGSDTYTTSYGETDRARAISSGTFRCVDANGQVALEISKQLAVRHSFDVQFAPVISVEIGVLAAVALDLRYFQLQ